MRERRMFIKTFLTFASRIDSCLPAECTYLLLLDGGLEPEPPPGPDPIGVRIWRKRLRLRLRAFADLSFAFCPGGIKCACFLRSLIISSLITLRLKRRSALSIDSLLLTDIYAIYAYHPLFGRIKLSGRANNN